MTVARDNLDALTGLRFVAAFTIALGHYYQPWLELTGIGMPLFFTLSGFIIHYVYADGFSAGWGRTAGEFAIARFSRIFPLYLVLLLLFFACSKMGTTLATAENFPVMLAYLTGVWTWFPIQVEGHMLQDWEYHISWSVSTELFFYVAYAAVLYRLARLRSIRHCLAILIGFCVVAYAMFYVIYLTRDVWEAGVLRRFPQFAPRTDDFANSFYRWALYISPYARIFEFIGGVLTCQLFRLISPHRMLVRRISSGATAWLAIGMMVVLFGFFRYYGEFNPWLATGNHSLAGFIVNLHMNFLFAPACYLLIFSLAIGGAAIGRFLASRPARLLGDISYSTYLSHPFADRVLMLTGLVVTSTVLHLLAIMVVIYTMSWVLYSIVEVPAKRWLRQMFRPHQLGLTSG
ncbi:MAG: acyltransferase [Acetobacteraceae bacterium]|jgi:peptidoglycan/LPS O-acetylase OafA/YrhL